MHITQEHHQQAQEQRRKLPLPHLTTTTAAAMSTSAQDLGNILQAFDMAALKTQLPKKRKGLSKYFAGESKSFACLADAKCVDDLKKTTGVPESKRRKYLERNAHVL